MFGTVARVRVKPGQEQELITLGEQWTRERGPATGQVAGYVFKLEETPREYLMVDVFRDRDTYYRNASDPETDRWYRRMRALLEADPEWNDGEVVLAAVLSGDR